MRFEIGRTGRPWSENVVFREEAGSRSFVVEIGSRRTVAVLLGVVVAGTIAIALYQLVRFLPELGLPVWVQLVIFGLTGVASFALAVTRRKYVVKDSGGAVVATIRSPRFDSTYRFESAGTEYRLKLDRGRREGVLRAAGLPNITIRGDISRQRYELERDGDRLARVFSYGIEPGPSVTVELDGGTDPLPLLLATCAVELTVRPHARTPEDAADVIGSITGLFR